MDPNASEQVRTGPSRSEQVRQLTKPRETFEKVLKLSRFFHIFSMFSQVFFNVFGLARTCSDLFGCIWMRLDAFECIWMRLEAFGHFQKISDLFLEKYVFRKVSQELEAWDGLREPYWPAPRRLSWGWGVVSSWGGDAHLLSYIKW